MKRLLLSLMLSSALIITAVNAVHASSEDPMIEVGIGAAAIQGDAPVEVLLKVEIPGVTASGGAVVLARFKGSASFLDAGNIGDYLDIHFEPLALGMTDKELGLWVTFLDFDLQRNIPLGNDLMCRVSVLGGRANYNKAVSENFKFFINAAFDMIGLGLHKVGNEYKGQGGMGANVEFGAIIAKDFRIVLGEKIDAIQNVDKSRVTGQTCTDTPMTSYVDSSGKPHYSTGSCTDTHATVDGDSSYQFKTSLDLVYDLSKNLSVFASPNFVVYVRDTFRDEVKTTESNSAFQVMFGVSAKW